MKKIKIKPATPFDGVAWVTGASSGLGRETALSLVRRGWRVVVTARNHEKLVELKQEADKAYGKVIIKSGDVCDAASMRAIVDDIEENHGGLGLVILNAGIYLPMGGDDLRHDIFQKTFSVNFEGVLNGLLPAIDAMRPRKRGQIALISSVAGYRGLPNASAYGATKAALNNLAESLKFDLDKMGLMLNIVNPGFIDTPATAKNPFEMPDLMEASKASEALVEGLQKGNFEINFPRRFTFIMKIFNLLPHKLYFFLINKMTKWPERPLKAIENIEMQNNLQSEENKRW